MRRFQHRKCRPKGGEIFYNGEKKIMFKSAGGRFLRGHPTQTRHEADFGAWKKKTIGSMIEELSYEKCADLEGICDFQYSEEVLFFLS